MPDVSLKRRGWSVEYVDDVKDVAVAHGVNCEDDEELDGVTLHAERAIWIDSEIEGQTLLEAELHELAHARQSEWHENFVRPFARDLARALWKLGWRCAPRRARP